MNEADYVFFRVAISKSVLRENTVTTKALATFAGSDIEEQIAVARQGLKTQPKE